MNISAPKQLTNVFRKVQPVNTGWGHRGLFGAELELRVSVLSETLEVRACLNIKAVGFKKQWRAQTTWKMESEPVHLGCTWEDGGLKRSETFICSGQEVDPLMLFVLSPYFFETTWLLARTKQELIKVKVNHEDNFVNISKLQRGQETSLAKMTLSESFIDRISLKIPTLGFLNIGEVTLKRH